MRSKIPHAKEAKEKQMKIITVVGNTNTGKTTLIKYTFDMLVRNGAFVLYYDVTGAKLDDIRAVVIWNGKVISFCSIGDEADDDIEDENDFFWRLSYIRDGIKIATSHKAEIFLNACNLSLKDDYKTLLTSMIGSDSYECCKLEEKNSGTDFVMQTQKKYNELLEKMK